MKTRTTCVLGIIALTMTFLAGTAFAGLTPEAKCEAERNQEAGDYIFCLQKAETKLARTQGACTEGDEACYPDDDCPASETCVKDPTRYDNSILKCEEDFIETWARMEAHAADMGGTCPDAPLTAAEFKAVIDECSDNLATALAGGALLDGPATCNYDLGTTQASLTTCNTDLGTCITELGSCNTNYQSCTGSLMTCNSSLGACTTSLGTCNADLSTTQASLTTCNGNYTTCTGNLTTCTTERDQCVNTDLPPAQACGNGSVGPGEECDGSNLNGNTCATVGGGYVGGTLGCGAGCAYDESGCYAMRYVVDNVHGTISDYETGLMWEKKAGLSGAGINCAEGATPPCDDPHDADNRYTWSAPQSPPPFTQPQPPFNPDGTAYTVFLAQLNAGGGFAGHTDWRLPTREELESIVDWTDGSPPAVEEAFDKDCTAACDAMSCSCTAQQAYWSSSTTAFGERAAWVVFFTFGGVENRFKDTSYYAVRAVRTGL